MISRNEGRAPEQVVGAALQAVVAWATATWTAPAEQGQHWGSSQAAFSH